MRSFSFVHTADLHLDSPFKGISDISESISAELTKATFATFNRIVDFCIEKEVDFLLVAGDVYDGADRSLRAQLRFRDGLRRLHDSGISAYIAHGNHDPLDGWSANLDWPKNVHIFGGKSVETVRFEKDGEEIAQICGTSFRTRKMTANLARKFSDTERPEEGLFNIGLLHCNVGRDTGHEPYAPCTLKDLIDLDFDYWALGHVHKGGIINEDPPVVYAGNPQGLHPGEVGAKGCFLVSVNEKGKPTLEFNEMDSVRWFVEEMSIDSLHTEEEIISGMYERIEGLREKADGRPALCRLVLTGRSAIHSVISRKGVLDDILRDVRENEEGEEQFVWIESIEDDTRPQIDRESLLKRKDFMGDLVRQFEEIFNDTKKMAELKESLEPLLSSPSGRKLLKDVDNAYLTDLIKTAEVLCLDKLIGDESS